MHDEYDSPWKIALERYFPEFMAFFFPDVYKEIDWTAGYQFLDKELQQVTRDAELGRRFVDKLVQVRKVSGDEGWVSIHVEVQGGPEEFFTQRMFTYHYRLFDRYARPLASLAVLADDNIGWRPDSFGYEVFGCRMRLDFPVVKLLDWETELEHLLESDNAFALVTAAHLLTRQTRNKPLERYAAKIRLIRILFARGWKRQRILDLFSVLDWLIRLPDNLETKIFEDIRQIEEENKMQYVTSIERIAMEKGMQQGMQKGMQKGMQQGMQKGMQQGVQQGMQQGVQLGRQEEILEGIEDLMEVKFGESGLRLIPEISRIKSLERLREIKKIIKDSKVIDEVEQKIVQ